MTTMVQFSASDTQRLRETERLAVLRDFAGDRLVEILRAMLEGIAEGIGRPSPKIEIGLVDGKLGREFLVDDDRYPKAVARGLSTAGKKFEGAKRFDSLGVSVDGTPFYAAVLFGQSHDSEIVLTVSVGWAPAVYGGDSPAVALKRFRSVLRNSASGSAEALRIQMEMAKSLTTSGRSTREIFDPERFFQALVAGADGLHVQQSAELRAIETAEGLLGFDLSEVREFGKRHAGWVNVFRNWQPEMVDVKGQNEEMHESIDDAEVVVQILRSVHPQIILHGPPGTGKTRLARLAALRMIGESAEGNDDKSVAATLKDEERVEIVVFHPAYDYDQFIGGLSVTAKDGHPFYEPAEGCLVRLAERAARAARVAREASDARDAEAALPAYVLIIDEINRGNAPRLFGELLYALEYRDSPVTLSFRHGAFELPSNLFIIGTMNTADRSVDSLDVALRRRFAFYHLDADAKVVETHWKEKDVLLGIELKKTMESLNRSLQLPDLEGLAVGPSYFLANDVAELRLKVQYSLTPLIDEYARQVGDGGQLKAAKAIVGELTETLQGWKQA